MRQILLSKKVSGIFPRRGPTCGQGHHRGTGCRAWGIGQRQGQRPYQYVDSIVGDLPGKTKVHKAEWRGVKISTLDTLEQLLQGVLTFQEFIDTPAPVIENYSEDSKDSTRNGTVGELVAEHGGSVKDKGRGHTNMLIV